MMKGLCEGEAGVHHVEGCLLTVSDILILVSPMKDR